MRYIGPFLRINSLTTENVKNQLFHFTKESLKHINLSSSCGVTTSFKDLKIQSSPNIDINIFKEISPLLCIYKKANGKVLKNKHGLYWEESSFKKDIIMEANILNTLCLLSLSNYYYSLEGKNKALYSLGTLYSHICKSQLDFYYKHLKNEDGIFIDKQNVSEGSSKNMVLEYKEGQYKASDQGFMMLASFKYSLDPNSHDSENYKNFAMDILNMFCHYRDELYDLPNEDRAKLLLSLNLFYKESKDERCKELLMDIMDYHIQCFNEENRIENFENSNELSLNFINIKLFMSLTGLELFTEEECDLSDAIKSLYDERLGVLIKKRDKKEFKITSSDILIYLTALLLCEEEEKLNNVIIDAYKRHLISSGLVGSWPDCPNLDSVERYLNFSLKAEDLLGDENFKPNSIQTPEVSSLAPIFYKTIYFNTKKATFTKIKSHFDSSENMLSFFMILYFM